MLLLDYKKTCTKCGKEKSCREFYNRPVLSERKQNIIHINDGYRGDCKLCRNARNKVYRYENKESLTINSKKWQNKNKSVRSAKSKLFRQQNKEKVSNQKKAAYLKNRKHYLDKRKINHDNNKISENKKNVEYIVKRLKHDTTFRFLFRIRTNLKTKIRRYKLYKWNTTSNFIGCTINQLLQHLQKTAIENGYMRFNINNYNGKEYHIDHYIPCSAFNLKCKFHQKLCFHYSNLQILSAHDNLTKHDTLPKEFLAVA